jgi:MFS family permease
MIYAAAAASRLIGLYFFSRMTFPATVTKRRHEAVRLEGFLVPLRDRNYLRFLAFNGLFGFFLFMGLPFYSVFVLRGLSFSLGDLTVMTTLASLAGLVSVNTWGPLTDRFGVRPVMIWSVGVWTLSAGLLWFFTGPEWRLLAYPSFIVYGFMWTLFQLLQFNFMLKMAPASHRTYFISTFYATTYLLTFFGPFAGGWLLRWLPGACGTLLGRPLTSYHVVLVGSLALCLATIPILRRVVEPAAASVREMVRHMRSSAELNPVLMLVSLAQELFGGRAFETILRESKRALRKQGSALADVGEELAQESWRALRRPFQKPPES